MIDATRKSFADELAAFERQRPAWVSSGFEGKWAICQGSDCRAPYDSSAEAWDAGLALWGGPGFLLKKIRAEDEPVIISHIALRRE